MSEPRYVVAGAALPRAAWFPLVSQWANAGAIPVEFVKCVGVAELTARLDSGRPFSAVLLDGALPGLDRDLLADVRSAGAVPIVVADPRSGVDWTDAGAAACLPVDLDRAQLLDALATCARPIHGSEPATPMPAESPEPGLRRGRVVAVVGAGGTGSSTIAMALAEAFGRRPDRAPVVLADFCLAAEQAMLHDTRAVAPGLQELVELHRGPAPEPEQVRRLCFRIDGRGYDLVLGIRRRRLWTTLRPDACGRALEGLAGVYGAVVIDCDADVEGESECGSIDVEERNVLARTALRAADEVVAVGQASLKGLHSLNRVLADLRGFGIGSERIHPVLNLAPSGARARAGYAKALVDLCPDDAEVQPVRFVPFRPVDECLRAVAPLPAAVVDPFASLVDAIAPAAGTTPRRSSWSRLAPRFLQGSEVRT